MRFAPAALLSASLLALSSAASFAAPVAADKAKAAQTKASQTKAVAVKTVQTKAVQTKAVPNRAVAAKPALRAAAAPRVDYTSVGSIGSYGQGWLVTVNGKARVSTKYLGDDKYGFIAWPTLSFRRPGAPVMWSSPDDSISFRAVESSRFAFGPTLAYRAGRYNSNAPELRGIHKPKWTVEIGAFGDVWLAQDLLRARVEVRRGLRERDGVVADFGVDWVMKHGAFTFAAGPRAKWGNDGFMRERFGVTQDDNLANPTYAAYAPKNAFYALGAYGSASYKQDANWTYTLHGGYDRLRGDAAKSPIVTQSGSKNQWSLGAVVSYTFEWK